MSTTPKYKAKAVFWHSEWEAVLEKSSLEEYRSKNRLKLPEYVFRFDSQHEFKVYLELCRMYGRDRVLRQFPVQVIPPGYCYPKGKTWKVDFAIKTAGQLATIFAYVEAKGFFLPEFTYTLAALEQAERTVFDNLYIAFANSIPIENKVVKALFNSDHGQNLLTLKELEQLAYLPSPL